MNRLLSAARALRPAGPLRSAMAITVALALGAPLSASAAGGGGGGGGLGGMSSSSSSAREKTPAEIAQSKYERGLKQRDRALAYEEKARVRDESWFGKSPSEKAVEEWGKAVESYRAAIEKKSDLYEAHSDLGFALRKLGDYDASLAAYDRALEIRSDYAPAIEYRGEAYLKLARLSDAQDAYMRLFVLDRALADQLMEFMRSWLAETGAEPVAGVAPEELSAFRQWVEERAQMAAQAGGDVSDARSW